MYYKITNKESQLFRELHALRTKEREIEQANRDKINKKIKAEFTGYKGHQGQQNFWRVTQYSGFVFTYPENIDKATWREDKDNPGLYIPNRRTKKGKEMHSFLNTGEELQSSNFQDVLHILKLDRLMRFSFPFLEIAEDVLILYIDAQWRPKFEDLIEITRTEFEELQDKAKPVIKTNSK